MKGFIDFMVTGKDLIYTRAGLNPHCLKEINSYSMKNSNKLL